MNAQDYTIVVQKTDIEGEALFKITVVEFPDIVVYEENLEEAYSIALETIEGLIEMAKEMGHQVPAPSVIEEREFSGKITFRPGKDLHRKISIAAERDGISLNQWMCAAASDAATTGKALAVFRSEVAETIASIVPDLAHFVGAGTTVRTPLGWAARSWLDEFETDSVAGALDITELTKVSGMGSLAVSTASNIKSPHFVDIPRKRGAR